MIAFASFFLGLVVGTAPVTVLVERPTASVRFELDGKAVGTVSAAPWTLPVDFGPDLLPHELVARAFGRDGREMGAARQFVNLPRPPAEVEVLLERDPDGHAVAARFSAQSLVAFRPARVAVTFDDKPLPVEESSRVALPPHDPEARHVLTVELEFSSAIRTRADVVFGAGVTSFARSELTAVPVRWTALRGAPAMSALEGALQRGGQTLRVTAVEQGPALVCVVRGPTSQETMRALGTGGRTSLKIVPGGGRLPVFDIDASRSAMALDKEDRLRFIWPFPRTAGAAPGAQLFDMSKDLPGADSGVHWDLTRVDYPGLYPSGLTLADAATVAGLQASASGSRRAVVLILGDEAADTSRESPASTRRYLEAIRVPFFVWSLKSLASQPRHAAWGAVEDVSSFGKLGDAVARLKAAIATQHIVWVEGRYLPQEIALSEKAAGLSLVR